MKKTGRFSGPCATVICYLLATGIQASDHPQKETLKSSDSGMAWIVISVLGPGDVYFHDVSAARADTQTQNSFPTNSSIILHARPISDAIFIGWFGAINSNAPDVYYQLLTNQVIEARFITRTMQLKGAVTSRRGVLVSLTNSFQIGIDLESTSDFKEWKPFLKHSVSNNPPYEILATNGHQLFLRSSFRPP